MIKYVIYMIYIDTTFIINSWKNLKKTKRSFICCFDLTTIFSVKVFFSYIFYWAVLLLALTASIKVGPKSTFFVKLRKGAVWPPSGYQKLIVLNVPVLIMLYSTLSGHRRLRRFDPICLLIPAHQIPLWEHRHRHICCISTSNSSSSVTATTLFDSGAGPTSFINMQEAVWIESQQR